MTGPDDPADLPEARFRKVVAIRDWLLGDARTLDPNVILDGLCHRLRDAGVPVHRAISAVELRHAETAANARIWELGSGAREYLFGHGQPGAVMHGRRPLATAHETGEWLFLWLPDTPDDAFDMVRGLKAAGYVHHISVPVRLLNGMRNGFTFATKHPSGFSGDDIAVLRAVRPALAALMEILAIHRVAREVLQTYVGTEPQRRIMSGDVVRGEVLRIRAAILFADMRSYTSITSSMTPERATDLVNQYYDCVVPAVEDHGGEVLKFIGDGILAIVRAGQGAEAEACSQAYQAAATALAAVAARNAGLADGGTPFEVGIALHFGEVAYGNVGSGARLDYTVIGRDVNLGARIAGLCGGLDQPLLVSSAFEAHLNDDRLTSVGTFDLRGLDAREQIFAPTG